MAGLIGRNTRVEVQSAQTLASAKTISALTNANPAVATSTAHGYSPGDYVVMFVQGMTELDGQVVRISASDTNTFTLEGVDSTNYGVYSSATSQKVSGFTTLGIARSVTAGGVSANRIESTTLLDSEKQYLLGQSDTPEITIDGLSNPFDSAYIAVETAARNAVALVFRVTMQDGSKRLFRGTPSLPAETIPLDALVTMSFSVVQIKRRLVFAT